MCFDASSKCITSSTIKISLYKRIFRKSILLLFIFFSIFGFAQSKDSLLRLYNTQTIYRYGNAFKKGNERINFSNLKREFSFSELGMADYQMARKYKLLSLLTNIAASGCSYAAVLSLANSNWKAGYMFFGSTLILGFGSGYYRNQSARHLDRALWQRNKDLLFH